MQDFKKLKVWQKAHEGVLEIYQGTAGFPVDERFGVTSQIRRAAISIPSNIAEGCSRDTGRDFSHFLRIGLGSANEVQYLLLLSSELGFLDRGAFARLEPRVEEVRRMLISLIARARPSNF